MSWLSDTQAKTFSDTLHHISELRSAVGRVRELHKECDCCETSYCVECEQIFPCATIRALDGEQA